MPNPRKPTSLLALSGATAKNPGRYADRANEPVSSEPIGDAPAHLNDACRAIWNEVVSLIPAGVLQPSDRLIVEIVCHLTHELRTGQSNVASFAQLRQALASLGMTPSERSRVSASPAKPQDDPLQYL